MVSRCCSPPSPACFLFLPGKLYFLLRQAGTALQNPVQPEWSELPSKRPSWHGQKPLCAQPVNEYLPSALNCLIHWIGPWNQSRFHGMVDRNWWLASMERTSPIPSHSSPPALSYTGQGLSVNWQGDTQPRVGKSKSTSFTDQILVGQPRLSKHGILHLEVNCSA